MSVDPQDLVDRIYEAGIVSSEWPTVLDELAQVGDGVGALLFSLSRGEVRWVASPSLQREFSEYVNLGWPARTDRAARLLNARHAGFLDDLAVYTPEELEREPVFVEFLRPRGVGRGAATGIPVPTGDTLIVSVERAYARGPATREIIDRLDQLRPHLARAALLSARLQLERAHTAAAALALIGLPASVLGSRGHVLAMNELFEALVPKVARDQRERLVIAQGAADALFAQALANNTSDLLVRSIPIAASGDDPPMIVHLLPVRRSAQDLFGGAGSIVIVTPVQQRDVPSAEVLEGLFDLTPAEARVARAIAGAKRIEEIAGALGVSPETVRSQLKMVLSKTGLRRQAELSALLAGLSLGQR